MMNLIFQYQVLLDDGIAIEKLFMKKPVRFSMIDTNYPISMKVEAVVPDWLQEEFSSQLAANGAVMLQDVFSWPPSEPGIPLPRWLFDDLSLQHEVAVVHTCYPRFIARIQDVSAAAGTSGVQIDLYDPWVLVIVDWIDDFDLKQLDAWEICGSLIQTWERVRPF